MTYWKFGGINPHLGVMMIGKGADVNTFKFVIRIAYKECHMSFCRNIFNDEIRKKRALLVVKN